jgi:HEAT repeat protein
MQAMKVRAARTTLVLLSAAMPLAFVGSAHASPWEDDEEPPVVHTPAPTVSPTSMAGMFGLPSLSMAMKSNDASVRAAAVSRAAEVATTASEQAAKDDAWRLVESAAADNGDDLDGALYVRLAAARALAIDPRREGRTSLEGLLGSPEPMRKPQPVTYPAWGGPTWGGPWGPGPQPAPPPKIIKPANGDLVRFVRETAAMALGARGEHDPLLIRARARDNVEASRAAFGALVAYPAPSLSNLIPKNDSTINRDTVDLLARLNDMRAADVLVRVGDGKDDTSAAIAVLALARLGDARAVRLARAVTNESRPELRVAAAEALAILGDPNAEGAITPLLSDDKTSGEGKRLALKYPSAGLIATIEKLARKGDVKAIAALGRAGATNALISIASDDSLPYDAADGAAYQLAVDPLDDHLAQLLDKASDARKRRIVRAGAVRVARVGSTSSSIKSLAKELASSKDANNRAAGTFFLGVSSIGNVKAALESDDAVRRRAAVAALAAHPIVDVASVARAHLDAHASTEPVDIVQALAGIAARAVDGTVARDVPISTSVLATWLSEDSAASPLAAFLLAARGGDAARAHVSRALSSDSLDVRAAALLGLGLSPENTATGEISSRLRVTPYPVLRRAAIRALVARGDASSSSKATIDLEKRLDPDLEVRNVASAAKVSSRGSPLLAGSEVAQVKVSGGTIATVTGLDGLTLPHVIDPDGFVFAFRVAPGPTRIEARATGKP